MKMVVGADLPEDYELAHEDLAASAITLMAHALLPLFAERMPEDIARANVEGIVTELSYLFDEGEIEIGGKTYHPRLAFVEANGAPVPGHAELNQLHELADAPFDIDPAADISFEAPEYLEQAS